MGFVDSTKPLNLEFTEYLSPYIYICTDCSSRSTTLCIQENTFFRPTTK